MRISDWGSDVCSSDLVEGRIASLARAHSLLASNRWNGIELRHLLEEELAPYIAGQEQRLSLTGPSLLMSAELAQALALVLHALAPNAATHGAFSDSSGSICVSRGPPAQLAPPPESRRH